MVYEQNDSRVYIYVIELCYTCCVIQYCMGVLCIVQFLYVAYFNTLLTARWRALCSISVISSDAIVVICLYDALRLNVWCIAQHFHLVVIGRRPGQLLVTGDSCIRQSLIKE